MGFSFVSWNVENFDADQPQATRVADHIRGLDPDVFGLFEIQRPVDVFNMIQQEFPGFDFGITDGPQNKEILVGWRRSAFDQATFTQKREFSLYNPYLRPGALLSLRHSGVNYHLLFLHTDSGQTARDFGNRFEMFEKVWKMKRGLDKLEPGLAKLIVAGDLNTMGLRYPRDRKTNELVPEGTEIESLADFARLAEVDGVIDNLRLLRKQHADTFNSGYGLRSDLDHVLATSNVTFDDLGIRDAEPYQVRVIGWNQLSGPEMTEFIQTVSDHSALYAKVA